jgi:tetratricopeptide (TPR) repeat protein
MPISPSLPTGSPLRTWLAWRQGLAAACLGLGLTGAGLAQTAPYVEVQRLIDARQWAPAQQQADTYLAEQPRDPQMRLLKGVIQSAQGQDDDALSTFNALTQDYPELPEPYNNLAVLHAKRQQLDQARAALEMAVRLNPRYATAQQNLGDVHGRLALQAYQEALRLKPDQPELRARLSALQTALSTPATP